MSADAIRMRGKRPFAFTDASRTQGIDSVIDFIIDKGGLSQETRNNAELAGT